MKELGFTVRFSVLHIWLLTLVNVALIAAVLLGGGLWPVQRALLATPSVAEDPDASSDAVAIDEDALNGFGQSMIRAGVPQCAVPMNQLAARLLVGNKVGGYRFPVTEKGVASLSLEVTIKSGGTAYMSFNMTETGAKGCVISYEAVSQWEDKCSAVAKAVLAQLQETRKLGDRISIFSNVDHPNRKTFVMPVKSGCIVVEKEVLIFNG